MATSDGVSASRPAPSPELLFLGVVGKYCIKTQADPVAIASFAKSGELMPVDRVTVPGESPTLFANGKAYTATHAWQFERAGTTFWVSALDVPASPKLRQCFVSAWNLDPKAVDAVFTGGQSQTVPDVSKRPVKQYAGDGYTILYTLSGLANGVLHVASFYAKPQTSKN